VVQLLKKSDADYASWMITVTHKVEWILMLQKLEGFRATASRVKL